MLDLTALTARELSRQISAGELSPIAVVEAYLAKIRVMNGRLNAFVDVYEEQARREAERVQARVKGGQLLGPLHGVPIVIKDLFEVDGKTTTAGSLHWRDRKSECTAAAITKLLRCGMIVLGKTQTVEFGLGTSGTNQRLGTPRNPWSVC